jgi:hypothetical protein
VAAPTPAPTAPGQGVGEVELINVTPRGFEPRQLTRPVGRFLLGVNNRAGLSEMFLQLVDGSAQTVANQHTIKEKAYRQAMTLPPGHYVLKEAKHPDWQCQITITPHN